jgi:LemA protein
LQFPSQKILSNSWFRSQSRRRGSEQSSNDFPSLENFAMNPSLLLLAEMSTALIILLSVGGFFVILILWMISVYNGLVVSRNQYKNSFAQIDVQLKRRYDLIPNLVETVKGYMAHEKDTLEAVINARNRAYNSSSKAAANPGDPAAMKELGAAESQLGGALGRLMAISEAYPDLKANQNMMQLQEELTSTENKVGYARQAFNDAVTAFNNQRSVFPTVIVAGMFGFTEAQLLETEIQAREAPKISFK